MGRHLVPTSLRAAMLSVAVGAGCLGAMTGPARVTLLGAPVVGAVAAAVPRLAAWGLDRDRPSPRTLALAGGTGVLAVPLVLGTALLAPGSPVLPAVLLALAAAGLGLSRAGSPSPRGDGAGARPPSARGARSGPAPRR